MRSRDMISHIVPGSLFALVLALVPVASTDALAQPWQGITEAENRIVFSGRHVEDYTALHHYHPVGEGTFPHEHYRARWTTAARRLPVFWVDLYLLPSGRHFPASRPMDLEQYAKGLEWLKDKFFSTVDSGAAGTAMGPADFLVFSADRHRCGVFVLYFDDGTVNTPDTLGRTRVNGFYCPISGQVDGDTFKSLLSRLGIRGIAVPKADEPQVSHRPALQPPSAESLATLVATGDIKGLRRVVAKGFDPDTVIPFQHPRFARGRLIRRPIIVAAALFGQTEMVVFLLNKGASTSGASGGAICAAIARRHPDIVDVLLKKDPELKNYDRCGQNRNVSPMRLARRLNLWDIVDKLRQTNSQ